MEEPAWDRANDLQRLASHTFDLLVLGGGITGAGIARDAALRGLDVALIDKCDFASGTSSRSSKLVHGGLRYLQQAQLKLVFEGTNERALLMRLAPHLVRPLEFLVPAYRLGFYTMIWTGLLLYDMLALRKPPAGHRRWSARQLHELEPALRREHLVGGLTYFDCATDDSRLTLENVLDARATGAICASYVRALAPLRRRGGRISGLEVEDVRTGARFAVQARVVVGALGPWTDRVLHEFATSQNALLRPTKGVHVIVDAARLPVRHAVTMASRDKRIVFCLPAGPRTVVGTTDTDYRGDYDAVAATLEDVVYLLGTANFYFPEARLRPEDVIATYAGLRPLIAATGAAYAVPREHEIFVQSDGMIVIAGGKLTTYRRMAREAVDKAVARLQDMGFGENVGPCSTFERRLPGAFPPGIDLDREAARLGTQFQMAPEVAYHLARTYGARADRVLSWGNGKRVDPELPYLWCEIEHAIREEVAVTVSDVLWRRVPIFLYARDQGLAVCQEVSQRLAVAHGLSEAARQRQIDEYRAQVELSRAFHGARAAVASLAR